jgi:hypothetical protein
MESPKIPWFQSPPTRNPFQYTSHIAKRQNLDTRPIGSNASGSGHRMDWTANGPLHPMMFDEDYYYPSGNLNVVYWKIYQ